MAEPAKRLAPRTFFLNEHHELPVDEKSGGGRSPQYDKIDWTTKGQHLNASLKKVKALAASSKDPMSHRRYFLIAAPEPKLTKRSSDKRKAPTGTYDEVTDFKQNHTRVFGRLGLDLIDVTDSGLALVHATPERLDVILQRTESLNDLSERDRVRWATIRQFEQIPADLRVDRDWLQEIGRIKGTVDAVIELQPLLSGSDVDVVMRALVATISAEGESRLTGVGVDYSGRSWFRGRLNFNAVNHIAENFISVQAIHDPLISLAAIPTRHTQIPSITPKPTPPPSAPLPVVAILDTPVAQQHPELAPYMRGLYVSPTAWGGGDHGTYVASRIVFGDVSQSDMNNGVTGNCNFLSADVTIGLNQIDEKSVVPTLGALRGAYPDVRVFNFSFSNHQPLHAMSQVKRKERLRLMRDLDNFIFANDVIVVACAGNSNQGVQPQRPYPDHVDDPNWQLGSWTAGFNVLVCGAFVSELNTNGLVQNLGWPSPFTRVGPGIANSPAPNFAAPGGNWDRTFNFRPGLGVWAMNPQGLWEDQSGTSLAAPILAREAAMTLQHLTLHCCPSGSRAFAVTVRAFLTLTAERPDGGVPRILALANRTLGYGRASMKRLILPKANSAIMIWQGEISGPKELLRINVPIPQSWLNQSTSPRLRLVACWDPPVNDATVDVWACRQVSAHVRTSSESQGLRPTRSPSYGSYPMIDRTYCLDKLPNGVSVSSDTWVIDLSYEETAEYYSGSDFTPLQRVGVALELFDESANPVSPQAAIQSLSVATTMTLLSHAKVPVRQPIVVRTQVE